MKIYSKNKNNFALAYGLYYDEFKCKCNDSRCHYTLVNPKLLKAYTRFRKAVNEKLIVSSGFRCQFWNEYNHGLNRSFHTVGSAIDLVYPKDISKDQFIGLAKLNFDFVLPYDTFIHCHVFYE